MLGSARLSPWSAVLHPVHGGPCGLGYQVRRVSSRLCGRHTAVPALERGADLHMAQLMPLPLTVSCFSKIQMGHTFLVPAHPGSPGQGHIKQ